jgi:two-component sensor histidine kinase
MGHLRDMSIRRKMLAVIMLTSSVALLLACGTFAAYDWLSTRESLVQRLTTMADVVGANCTAALVFDNPEDARQTLAALRAEPRLVAGDVYNRAGMPFAHYGDPSPSSGPSEPVDSGHRFGEDHLEVWRPIELDGERLGTMYLCAGLGELDERMARYGQIAVVFLMAASLVTLLIGWRLRAVITEPILRLQEAMQAVRDDPSYTVRAEKHGDDELGLLVDGFNAMLTQISDRDDALRTSLDEKEVLLKEVHHRVKNNLQIIASLLDLQANSVTDQATVELLRESRNRVRSMALIHEHLYGTEELARIDLPDYVRDLCTSIAASYGMDGVQVEPQVDDVAVDIDTAIPCGLIINELVSNALKYAFPDGKGCVLVQIRRAPEGEAGYVMTVADDGIGLPPEVDPAASASLGLQLVHALARQIHGALTCDRGKGTTMQIHFGRPIPTEGEL